MKKRIVFFDIDGVIFDGRQFLDDFCAKLSEKLNLGQKENAELISLYQETKKEKGFFDPQVFLTKILAKFPITREDLENLWWDNASFQNHLLVNENFIRKLVEKITIGIFSKGEINFQKNKLENFQDIINLENVYIFENKIIKIEEVLGKYKDYEIYVVDDNQTVLENFKKINNSVITVLIGSEPTVKENFIDFKLSSIQDFPEILE